MDTIQTLFKKGRTRKKFLGFLAMAVLIVLNIEPVLRLFGKGAHLGIATADINTIYGGSSTKKVEA